MKLIIGLGNPGKKYEKTRHNVGFMVLNKLQETENLPEFKLNKKFNAQISEGVFNDPEKGTSEKIILAKPQTFMNSSGKAVAAIKNFYKINPEDIIVIHDDLDLKLGEVKIKEEGSSGGHNGVQSIIDELGTDEFRRIKIGIGRPDIEHQTSDIRNQDIMKNYVLGNFSEEEMKVVEKNIEEAVGVLKRE